MEKLSGSLEDYLEAIYVEVLKHGCAKVTDIALALNVKKASVTSALNQLATKKLINYAPYLTVTMTIDGEKLAKKILQKHKVLDEFFGEVLALENASEIACAVEHLISDVNLKKIQKFISNL
ncbi:metal-dependent transcriptional regulator [bacterium]|nr:metal-dependent transcriptional regulator [bacterium]